MADVTSDQPAMRMRIPPAAWLAIAAAALTLPLLWTPWMHVESEPLCIMQDPCPEPERSTQSGLAAAGPLVLLFALTGALFLLWSRRAFGTVAAAAAFGAGALVAWLDPEGIGFLIFAHYEGAAWGAVAAALAMTTAAALAMASAVAGATPERRQALRQLFKV